MTFATYCQKCYHKDVCRWTDAVVEAENKMKNVGTSTSVESAPITVLCPNKTELTRESKLEWITPAEGRKSTYKRLYLAYQPGYPLMVADWKTGHGYRDVRTGESIQPTRVAYINLPDMEGG